MTNIFSKKPTLVALSAISFLAVSQAADRPNILWISSEDNGPNLGCYGDKDAVTPNLDALAKRGLRYEKCWSVAPVCAPARTALILGMYPSALGAEHMRSMVTVPAAVKMLPEHMRAAGYYCTNNVKEDYNVQTPGQGWHESSGKAHYRNRSAEQPFFAVFNFTDTHESGTRKRPHEFVHDPAKIALPPAHPDLPEARKAWAQVHDKMTRMDTLAGEKLKELQAQGLAENTIVFYFGDHGTGLPRYKRFPGQSGLRVPLIVHFPEKWKHLAPADYQTGGASQRLVSFVDFAPTLLSLAGAEIPKEMQGVAFAGKTPGAARSFNHGLRGRMDERYDLARSVTDGRHVYIKNYYPDLPWGQHNAYMFVTPMTQEWFAAFQAGKLPAEHQLFWKPKGAEELYDLQKDPGELKNLAADPDYAATLAALRNAQKAHAEQINDIAVVPEAELLALAKSMGGAPATAAATLPMAEIRAAALLATDGSTVLPESLLGLRTSPVAALRFWAVEGIRLRGATEIQKRAAELKTAMQDASANVRLSAAAALAAHGDAEAQKAGVAHLLAMVDLNAVDHFVAVAALNYWDNLPKERTAPFLDKIKELSTASPKAHARTKDYVLRLKRFILGEENTDDK